MDYFDETQVRKTISCLKPDGRLFEVRLLRKPKTASGYFTSADTLIQELKKFDLRGWNAYITLNEISDKCYARDQHDHFVSPPGPTTNDEDITGYDWLFVDLDPIRPTGISSSDDELQQAKELAKKVRAYLKENGFEEPVIAMSGNGVHLLYKISLCNNKEAQNLIADCLKVLALFFDTDAIKIDTVNYNPARICKLHGTLAQKGTGTDDRPHRMSYIVSVPEVIKNTKRAYLERLADKLPKQPKPEKYNNFNPKQFDLREWLDRHGIRYEEKAGRDCTKYVLDECPFDSNHKKPDASVFQSPDGKIGFHCFHNSCAGKTWQDMRIKFEPDAYSKREEDDRIQAGWESHKRLANREKSLPVYEDQEADGEIKQPMFYTMQMILDLPEETEDYIPTGIEGIDNRINGLKKGYMTLVSGLRGGSKSTLLSQIALNAIDNGYRVIAYSGELTKRDFAKWMLLQAAGKQHTKLSTTLRNDYYVPAEIQQKISNWMGDNFILYNNDYGNNFTKLFSNIRQKVIDNKADLVILDNLMAMNIRDLDPDKYEAQHQFAVALHRLCEECDIHIMFVAHPRKAVGFLRLDDVSGSADLSNLTDNAFIVHRNNEDFRRLSKDMFKWKEDNPAYQGTNVIEIAKDRAKGTQDVFIPLWYEPESKRLKNHAADMVAYKWEPDDFEDVADMDIPF